MEALDLLDENKWPLHRAAFINDAAKIKELLDKNEIDPTEKDLHGNTALHIAVMLGHKESINALIDHNVFIKIKNNLGWSPLAEAISYGDRDTIKDVLKTFKRQASELVQSRRNHLIQALESMGDFRLVLKWDFQSWVPFLSRILPSDVCTITKKGSCLRLDTTLVDFSEMRWVRGDISFLFLGTQSSTESLIVMDNEAKVFQRINTTKNSQDELERELDLLMSNEIVTGDLSSKSIEFQRAQSGWFWKEDRSELIGPFSAHFYNVSGLTLRSRRRREHLSAEDLAKNQAIMDTLTSGTTTNNNTKSASNLALDRGHSNKETPNGTLPASSSSPTIGMHDENALVTNSGVESYSGGSLQVPLPQPVTNGEDTRSALSKLMFPEEHRNSLPPPPLASRSIWTWDEYLTSQDGYLGREMVIKESKHTFKLTLAMSEEFPLTISSLLDVLEVVAPLKHFKKLREFVQMKLPPGFPVKLELPVLPAITARVTFQDFQFYDNMDDSLFCIPPEYVEDPTRFPDL